MHTVGILALAHSICQDLFHIDVFFWYVLSVAHVHLDLTNLSSGNEWIREEFEVPINDEFILPIGKAQIEREGTDITLVAYSVGVNIALEAAKELQNQQNIKEKHRVVKKI